jgi:hypothetical protein
MAKVYVSEVDYEKARPYIEEYESMHEVPEQYYPEKESAIPNAVIVLIAALLMIGATYMIAG